MATPFALEFQPGIQRDGTKFEANRYLDGLWCRWRLGKPRKMGGFKLLYDSLLGLPRKIHMFYTGDRVYIHIGTSNSIEQIVIKNDGTFVSWANRTPAGFEAGL